MLSQRPVPNIAIIDFDGTLCKFMFPNVGPIEPNVKEALETLKKAGYIIKIHSCRTAKYWNRPDERNIHIALIQQFMLDNKLPYDELILTMDKPIADVYVDDRAIRYENNWLDIVKKLKEKNGTH
jgi:predicted phosphatase